MNYKIYDADGHFVRTIFLSNPDHVALNTPPGGRAEPQGFA